MSINVYPKTVELKDGRSIILRPFVRNDAQALHAFLKAIPEEDRLFLRHDVRDPEVVQKWMEELDSNNVIPLLAVDDDQVVGIGRIHLLTHGWMQHVGHMRLITARTHRHQGLGGLIARELVALAESRNLEKLQCHVIEDDTAALRMCQTLGFETAGVLRGMVKDQRGTKRNLAILVSDVANLGEALDDWIQDSMVPAYRVPGACVG
ncbi:MAG: GNAT family N-acetyltransferase [bacterium]|nr:GNAT family N-acetyltransferase [bacterium]